MHPARAVARLRSGWGVAVATLHSFRCHKPGQTRTQDRIKLCSLKRARASDIWTPEIAPSSIDCMVSQYRFPLAPLDQAAVAESLRPFGESRMLPPAAYVDPAVFDWEQKHFFDGGWTCVGFATELPNPGDHRAVTLGPGSVLLSRDEDRALHAFANTCRHRGHE